MARPIGTVDWARVPVCGVVATYKASGLPPEPDRLSLLVGTLLRQRIKMQSLVRFDDCGPRWSKFAFFGLLEGKNFGKLVIQLAHEQMQPAASENTCVGALAQSTPATSNAGRHSKPVTKL